MPAATLRHPAGLSHASFPPATSGQRCLAPEGTGSSGCLSGQAPCFVKQAVLQPAHPPPPQHPWPHVASAPGSPRVRAQALPLLHGRHRVAPTWPVKRVPLQTQQLCSPGKYTDHSRKREMQSRLTVNVTDFGRGSASESPSGKAFGAKRGKF